MNPFTPAVKACPYPFYEAVREEGAVQWSSELNAWMVTSYAHALAVLMDDVTYSSKNSTFGGAEEEHPEFPSIITADGPQHKQVRSLAAKAFAPRTLDSLWEPRIRDLVEDLLDLVEKKPVFEVIGDMAELPARITAEVVGVEPERFEDFKRWSDEIVTLTGRPDAAGPASASDQGNEAVGDDSFGQLFSYLEGAVAERKMQPRDDLVTRLVQAEIDGVRLTDLEIVSFLVLLIVSGNDAVTDLIATGLRALVMQPELIEKIRENTGLISDLVEESLRWDSPFQCFYRRATVDAELGGKVISAGDALLVVYGAANRDPNEFAHPANFDIARKRRDHLAFGMGVHYCLGASLARLQARVAIQSIVERFESLHEVEGHVKRWRDTPFFRGLVDYPLTFKQRRS